jgi:hypothetical protein
VSAIEEGRIMVETKSLLASRTVWGGLIAILAAVLGGFGYTIAAADQAQLVEWIATAGGIAGGILAVVGRVRASKRIG